MVAIYPIRSEPVPHVSAISAELKRRIELSRIVLISAIVFHHIRIPSELTLYSWDNLGYLRGFIQIGLLKTATSTLTVLSGYLCFSSNFELHPFRFLRKRFRTLLVPMVIWNVPAALAIFMFQINGEYYYKYDNLVDGSILNWVDALLGLTKDPANVPLHFLRNIIACNIIAALVGGAFKRYTLRVFTLIFLIGILNLDGMIVLRDDILIGFFLGAAVATLQIDSTIVDKSLPIFGPIYLISALLIFSMQVDPSSLWWMLHRLLGFLAAWPLIGYLNRTRLGVSISKYSNYAFLIFLTHYYVGIVLFFIFSEFFGLKLFFLYFVIAGPLTIGVCIVGQVLAGRLIPSWLSILTGGEVDCRSSPAVLPPRRPAW